MVLINRRWEVVHDIYDIVRIVSENIDIYCADSVYQFYVCGQLVPFRIELDDSVLLIYKLDDLIQLLAEKINYDFAEIVETIFKGTVYKSSEKIKVLQENVEKTTQKSKGFSDIQIESVERITEREYREEIGRNIHA